MVYLAYDGTVNGDWVSRYALRIAAHHPSGRLCVVYIDEGRIPKKEVDAKIEIIQQECERLSLELSVEVCPSRPDVFSTLTSLIPAGPDVFLICGSRARERGHRFLAGTVGHRFLRIGGRHIMALRVVQPGLLGVPRRLLLPIAGRETGFKAGLPFLKLLAPDVTHVCLLHVDRVSATSLRRMTREQSLWLRRAGAGLCAEVEREILTALGESRVAIDTHAVVSDDVAKEIIIHAGKSKARLIYMGASERGLTTRLLSGSPLEPVLHDAPCDVAIYRGLP
jgi:nucleotide-binding universal stress UspA family protein